MTNRITMSNGRVTIHIDGVKRLLTMKSKVTFRSDHIVDIKQVNHPEPPILRAPGVTFGHYVGGSYYDVSKRSHQFWMLTEPSLLSPLSLNMSLMTL
jgi:hypothetical protein